jgi:hypothetical protein
MNQASLQTLIQEATFSEEGAIFMQTAQFIYALFYFSHGVRLSTLGTLATVWLIVPATDDR